MIAKAFWMMVVSLVASIFLGWMFIDTDAHALLLPPMFYVFGCTIYWMYIFGARVVEADDE